MDFSPLLQLSFALFLLMDPIGNVPIYVALLQKLPEKRQLAIIFRELLIALGVILLFAVAGAQILEFMGITHETIKIAGGIILFMIALKMIFPPPKDTSFENGGEKEPFIVPLAIPLVAGPSVLASVMIYGVKYGSFPLLGSAIFLAWVASTIILMSSTYLKRLLGQRGLGALERLMGFVLSMLGIEMFLNGLHSFLLRCT